MRYIPNNEIIYAFHYGVDQLPDWVKEISTLMPNRMDGGCYLEVKPVNDPDLNCLHIVHPGEFLVKRSNGSIWHFKRSEDFLRLMFKIEAE